MQKRHHTVSRCYLENFTDNNDRLWVLDAKNEIRDSKPENVFVENHFYRITLKDGSKSVIIENTLADIEGTYADVFRNKISKKIPLTLQDKANVAVFVAAMHHRTRPNRESMRHMFQDLKKTMEEWQEEYKTMTPEERKTLAATPSSGNSLSLDQLEEGLKNFDEQYAAGLIRQTMHTAQIILDMKWSIWHIVDGKSAFVTSDSPFVIERPQSIKKFGRNAVGSRPGLLFNDAEVTLPLSSSMLLLAGWILNKDSYCDVPLHMAEYMNQKTILHSSERIVASSKEQLETIKKKYPPRELR